MKNLLAKWNKFFSQKIMHSFLKWMLESYDDCPGCAGQGWRVIPRKIDNMVWPNKTEPCKECNQYGKRFPKWFGKLLDKFDG